MSFDERLEEVRGRSNHLFLEQPRRQRSRSASQNGAAARIGSGAVRNDGGVAMQDPDIFDPGAEFVGDHLRERGLKSLAM